MDVSDPNYVTVNFILNAKENKTVAFGTGNHVKKLITTLQPNHNKTILTTQYNNEIGICDNDLKFLSPQIDLFIDQMIMVKHIDDYLFVKEGSQSFLKSKIYYEIANERLLFVTECRELMKEEELMIPVEIVKEAYFYIRKIVTEKYKLKCRLRMHEEGMPYVTENNNFVLDVEYDEILMSKIKNITGVVETGIFETKEKTKIVRK